MNEAPGPINFTMFLTMFGERLQVGWLVGWLVGLLVCLFVNLLNSLLID